MTVTPPKHFSMSQTLCRGWVGAKGFEELWMLRRGPEGHPVLTLSGVLSPWAPKGDLQPRLSYLDVELTTSTHSLFQFKAAAVVRTQLSKSALTSFPLRSRSASCAHTEYSTPASTG